MTRHYFLALITFLLAGQITFAQQNRLVIHADEPKDTISRHIYGHFSEHLGRCIYDGIWVGEDSDIPNTNGYRNSVVEALKNINIPNLRWPGGCFADEYHWKDGIGPRDQRPEMVNTHWGGVVEDNSFGTHEFLDFCKLIDTEPYLAGNVGSGTVEEMSQWVEYINFDGKSPMADLRRENGQEEPWGVKYWGVGNESWGCGGNMTPEFYADQYRRYATFCRDYGNNKLYKVASGSNDWDVNWTEVLMKNIPLKMMDGISLHYYTITKNWEDKGSATEFDKATYLTTLQKSAEMDKILTLHSTAMDRHDPDKKVALIVDEWGTWFNVEPGTNPGFLYQQNTLRDAFVAAITLNIFHKHADRVKMANLAQTVNVLQALILTEEDKTILTPTYHVFDMYKVHQDAVLLPAELKSEDFTVNNEKMPALHASASKAADGTVHISLVNVNPDKEITLECELRGSKGGKVTGQILTADKIDTYNTFDQPEQIKLADFNKASIKNNTLKVTLPAKSIVTLAVK